MAHRKPIGSLERIAEPNSPGRVHEFWWYPRDKKRAA